jgi:hypothetical protein
MMIFVLALVIGISQGTKDKPAKGPNPLRGTAQAAEAVAPPISITVTIPPKTEEERKQEAQDRQTEVADRQRDIKAQETMALFTSLLFGLGVLQLFAAGAAVWAAFVAARVTKASERHFRVAERAYINITHKPPGVSVSSLTFTESRDNIGKKEIGFTVSVSNTGNTPAKVTFHNFMLIIGDCLPPVPVYEGSGGTGVEAFLVKSGSFQVRRKVMQPKSDWDDVSEGKKKLFIVGFVDYIDQFGQRHRTGYARVYDRKVDWHTPQTRPRRSTAGQVVSSPHELWEPNPEWVRRNNLNFVSEPGYNYDQLREPGEGNDWDEPEKRGQQGRHTD